MIEPERLQRIADALGCEPEHLANIPLPDPNDEEAVQGRIQLIFDLFVFSAHLSEGKVHCQIIRDNEELIDVANAARSLLMNIYEFETVTDGEFLEALDGALRRSRLMESTMPALPDIPDDTA